MSLSTNALIKLKCTTIMRKFIEQTNFGLLRFHLKAAVNSSWQYDAAFDYLMSM